MVLHLWVVVMMAMLMRMFASYVLSVAEKRVPRMLGARRKSQTAKYALPVRYSVGFDEVLLWQDSSTDKT